MATPSDSAAQPAIVGGCRCGHPMVEHYANGCGWCICKVPGPATEDADRAASSAARQLTVYAKVREEERTCEYGYKHRIRLVRAKVIYPTDRTWPMDNGYEKRQEAVYEDEEGREYRRMVTIDFSNNVYYLDPDNEHWRPRMASGDVLTDE